MLTHGAGSPRTRTDTGEGLHRVMSPPVPDSRAADQCQPACNSRGRVSARKDEDSYANVRLNWHACSQRLSRVGGACGQASLEDRVLTNSNTSTYIYIYIRTDIFALMIQIVFATGSRVAEMLPSREQSRGPGCFCTLCLHVHSAVAVASHATSADFTPPRPPAETHNNKCVISV